MRELFRRRVSRRKSLVRYASAAFLSVGLIFFRREDRVRLTHDMTLAQRAATAFVLLLESGTSHCALWVRVPI